jgi:hypothetical protein
MVLLEHVRCRSTPLDRRRMTMTPTPTRKLIRGSTRAPVRLGLALLLGTMGLGAVGAVALPASVASASTPLTASFTYTGSVQTWTVPADVVGPIEITATGGSGASGGAGDAALGTSTVPPGVGAPGAFVTMTVPATTGDTFDVYVGGAGTMPTTPTSYTYGEPIPGAGVGGTTPFQQVGGGALNGGNGGVAYAYTSVGGTVYPYGADGGGGGGMSGVSSYTACGSGPTDFCVVAGGGGGGECRAVESIGLAADILSISLLRAL